MSESYRVPLFGADQGVVGHALIDADDLELVMWRRWSLTTAGYAATAGRLLMHRLLLGLEPGDGRQADHVNCDRLDNRRSNLRVVTNEQNHQNLATRDALRGVTRHPRSSRFRARVTLRGKEHYLGSFDTPEEAAAEAAAFRADHMPFSADRRAAA